MALIPKRDLDVKTIVPLKAMVQQRTHEAFSDYARFRDEPDDAGGVGVVLDLMAEHVLGRDKDFIQWRSSVAARIGAENGNGNEPPKKRRGRKPRAAAIVSEEMDNG